MKLSALQAFTPEARSSVWQDAGTLQNPTGLFGAGYGYTNSARKPVNPAKAERVSAYYACKQIVSTTLAHFPLQLFHTYQVHDSNTDETLNMKQRVSGRVHNLLNVRASKRMKSYDARRQWVGDGYSHGRGIFLIENNPRTGEPTGLRLCSRSQGDSWYIIDLGDDIWYHLYFRNGDKVVVNQNEVLEFKPNQDGEPLVKLMAESLGINIASFEYFGNTMGNKGNRLKGLFGTDQQLNQAKRNEVINSFYDQIEKGNDMLVLDSGYRFQGVSLTPAEAQLIEFANMSIDEICRWFRVPQPLVMHLLKGTGFNSLEQLNLHFKTYTIDPLAHEIEQECKVKLLREEQWDDHYFRHDLTVLMRGDMTTQTNYWRNLWFMGALDPNEIRAETDRNPYPGGNQKFVPNNTTTPEMVAEMLAGKLPGNPANPSVPNPQNTSEDDE